MVVKARGNWHWFRPSVRDGGRTRPETLRVQGRPAHHPLKHFQKKLTDFFGSEMRKINTLQRFDVSMKRPKRCKHVSHKLLLDQTFFKAMAWVKQQRIRYAWVAGDLYPHHIAYRP